MVMFKNIYRGKRVLVTGHTGFKGSWLCQWLLAMDARVIGISLPPNVTPSHFSVLDLSSRLDHRECNICDGLRIFRIIEETKPEIVFHLAAQPLVRQSYRDPKETFETNVLGTVNVLDAIRRSNAVRACVVITSDKCYENRELVRGYCESDPMGGYDPYSASKGCAELVVLSYRNAFFALDEYGRGHEVLIASARAGNVIGGGDWGEDRLIPDIVRAVGSSKVAHIRNPRAIRPWQHVLDCLSGYLLLAQKLVEGEKSFAEGWNFGPCEKVEVSVNDVVEQIRHLWPKLEYQVGGDADNPHEANYLKLDCSKATARLKWKSVWTIEKALDRTIQWYKAFYESGALSTSKDLELFIQDARTMGAEWVE